MSEPETEWDTEFELLLMKDIFQHLSGRASIVELKLRMDNHVSPLMLHELSRMELPDLERLYFHIDGTSKQATNTAVDFSQLHGFFKTFGPSLRDLRVNGRINVPAVLGPAILRSQGEYPT